VRVASTQLRQTNRDKTRDNSSDGDLQGPPDIVVSLLLLEPPRFSFVTQPTKRRPPLQFIG
jgi:hypothetical protein